MEENFRCVCGGEEWFISQEYITCVMCGEIYSMNQGISAEEFNKTTEGDDDD